MLTSKLRAGMPVRFRENVPGLHHRGPGPTDAPLDVLNLSSAYSREHRDDYVGIIIRLDATILADGNKYSQVFWSLNPNLPGLTPSNQIRLIRNDWIEEAFTTSKKA